MFLDTDFLRDEEIRLVLYDTDPGDERRQWVPSYKFNICDPNGTKMGICDLRIGHNERVFFGGNIGYEIFEEYRGHHYAAKACRLLFGLARKHDMGYVLIACNPANIASRKTCEHLGCRFLGEIDLPADHILRRDGRTKQCVFRVDL
ncbi:GNAT family N-acetyltransferase [bacterium]|nr:GNAT family N-acetyltransferase [bacterium]